MYLLVKKGESRDVRHQIMNKFSVFTRVYISENVDRLDTTENHIIDILKYDDRWILITVWKRRHRRNEGLKVGCVGGKPCSEYTTTSLMSFHLLSCLFLFVLSIRGKQVWILSRTVFRPGVIYKWLTCPLVYVHNLSNNFAKVRFTIRLKIVFLPLSLPIKSTTTFDLEVKIRMTSLILFSCFHLLDTSSPLGTTKRKEIF